MTRVKRLEQEVKKLGHAELAAFRAWFRRYDADEWDRQIKEDVRTGRLDKLAEEALAEHKAGRTKEL